MKLLGKLLARARKVAAFPPRLPLAVSQNRSSGCRRLHRTRKNDRSSRLATVSWRLLARTDRTLAWNCFTAAPQVDGPIPKLAESSCASPTTPAVRALTLVTVGSL